MNLHDYDGVAVSISGGKDSQTILGVTMALVRMQAYTGHVFAIHADTGAEWRESLPHCELLCKHYGVGLIVAQPFRALPDHIERRCKMMAAQLPRGKPGWPSPAQRYCTSDCKRSPIQKAIRTEFPALPGKLSRVLSVTGERRQESSHRAKLPEFNVDKMLTTPTRIVHQWRPILDFTIDDVWTHIRRTGLPRHPAYDLGNERLSCAICVLACKGDICRGAKARPDLADRYLRIERDYGFTFMHKTSLKAILDAGKP